MRINCDHKKVVPPEEGSQYFREEIGLIMFSQLTDESLDDKIKPVKTVSVDGFDWPVLIDYEDRITLYFWDRHNILVITVLPVSG